jgi:hypothetical protein
MTSIGETKIKGIEQIEVFCPPSRASPAQGQCRSNLAYLVGAPLSRREGRRARHLKLRRLTRGEQRLLQDKLRDLILSVRVHQR